MALVIADRVRETSTTTGTGTLTLGGAATGYQAFGTAIGSGNTCYYAITLDSAWEVGIGTVGTGTLSRDSVLASSNSNSLVNFAAGTKDVFVTHPATAIASLVSGPASVVAGRIATFDGTSGKAIQDGGKSLPSGNIVGTTDTQTLTGKTIAYADNTLTGVQPTLTSGTTIKTINNASILGSGDIATLTSFDIGTNVQAYDSNLTSFVNAFTLPTSDGTNGQVLSTNGSGTLSFISAAGNPEIKTPTNVSPANAATNITETPTLTGSTYYSLYNVAMTHSQWQVSTVSNFASTVVSTGDVAGTAVSYTVSAGVLSVNTTYYWRVRYKDANGVYSDWSTATTFTTAAQFNSYIATPTATPSNFGDSFEGGFYAGLIWNQIAQSSSSKTLGTGTQTFTVPDMSSTPIVYSGQTIEVRSRANPANKFIGTVTGASGTTLTLNVTSIGGSGTFSDWSVMSRFRVIVAPKSSGENASVALKNADTAFPTACQTLTEGLTSTQDMKDAGTSTVYPAAHWARGLSINSRSDWYIPARDELELLWRNLKPVTNNNYTTADRPTGASFSYANNGSYGDTANTHGLNNNSSPTGSAYTTTVPGQTAATAFRTGGAEAFEFGSAYYWSSTEYSASTAWSQNWTTSTPGYQNNTNKDNTLRVRAVRRSII